MAFGALLAVLVLIHNTGGLLGAEVWSSIIGGQNAQRNGWPWMAHLNISDGVNRWRCGGTIVARQWVLTAASCWETNPPPNLPKSMIWVGSYELQKASVDYMGVSFFMKHPGYRALSGGGYVNDLALVKLKKPVTLSSQVKTVRLPRGDHAFGSTSECWITGWGYTGRNTPLPSPEILQQLKVSIIPHSDCKAKTPELTADMLCAGDMAGKKGACKGDYGGPLVCHTAAGYVQVGIMSYGDCGLPDHPGVYTKVSNYVSYINDYIKNGEEASA
ncbi:tryptase-2-like [Cebidichthys violaceus]|uniref:tryptase-2-like n=1 Tax=Cebidichthys violaceus TaxID=271503 RepID=UPI0035CC20AF